MPLYPRLHTNVYGAKNWIIHTGNLDHPLIVLADHDMQKFLTEVGRQQEVETERYIAFEDKIRESLQNEMRKADSARKGKVSRKSDKK